ncbi:MAG: helix-turn-helix domain-containing protein [Miniphocaeibacter sp.]|uniref:helix-turn-helix domain-containing protein n=1 Tax=Miniphocaeibacter sp. TaxID=3100973 RepID=UPI0018332A85|nr:helix-turn-helix domain-containing protein [Gallicola sp.]
MTDNKFNILNIDLNKNKIIEKYTFETTILFQLKGVTNIYLDGINYNMSKGNIMVINRNKSFILENISDIDNILVIVTINNSYFISIYDEFTSSTFELFPNEEKTGKSRSINELRTELARLLMYYSNPSSTTNISMNISINKIMLYLISYFNKEKDIKNTYVKNQKIIDILKDMDKNYDKKISIDGLAQKYYMSSSTLSKLFKEETGELFSKYLNDLRSTKSLKDLLYSSLNIEEIAIKNGFGNGRTYRRGFKEVFNCTPSEYRKQNNGDSEELNLDTESDGLEKNKDIFEILYSFINTPVEDIKQEYIIENNKKLIIDSSINRGQINPQKIIHVGSLDLLLDYENFTELEMIKEDIGINYIGLSSIYTSYPDSYLEFEVEDYYIFSEFGKFDSVVEYLVKNSIGIFYQISISDILNKKNNYYWQMLNFFRNYKNIYGKFFFNNIRINCIFDVDNIEKSNSIFKMIYDQVKLIDSAIEIGASIPLKYPNYSFSSKKEQDIYIKKIVPLCDFLSYSSDPNRIYKYNKNEVTNMDFFNEFVYKEVINIKNIVQQWNNSIPLVLSEWNTLTGEKQSINGTFFRAAIILQEVLKLDLLIESYGFWLNAGIYMNYKFDKENKFNSLELFHNYKGKKPVYNVLLLASRLKGNVRFLGKECMLLQEGDNYQLLLWNPNYFNPNLSEQLRFLESKTVLYNIEIPDIKDNYYQVKRFDYSRNSGAIYYLFQNFKSKYPLDLESREYLSTMSVPKISVFDVSVQNGFNYSFILDTNAIVLLEFKAIYK